MSAASDLSQRRPSQPAVTVDPSAQVPAGASGSAKGAAVEVNALEGEHHVAAAATTVECVHVCTHDGR